VITIRHMQASELERIAEIDRSEHVTRVYSYRRGVLASRAVDDAVPTWFPSGSHEHSVPSRVQAWRPILERGGTLIGAFDAETLAGVAIYRPRLAEGTANLSVLHVSRSFRRKGVASLLTEEVARLARADGARRLYVSATPSESAVGFYRSHGFVPTDEPDEAMFALEPEDIHMILEL
jgi:ribosomal protein S18 acetylase RimI-like enzyme